MSLKLYKLIQYVEWEKEERGDFHVSKLNHGAGNDAIYYHREYRRAADLKSNEFSLQCMQDIEGKLSRLLGKSTVLRLRFGYYLTQHSLSQKQSLSSFYMMLCKLRSVQ